MYFPNFSWALLQCCNYAIYGNTLETETPRSNTTSEPLLPTVSPAPNRVYLTGPGGGAEEAVLRSPGFEEKKGESSYPPNSNVVFVVTAQKG